VCISFLAEKEEGRYIDCEAAQKKGGGKDGGEGALIERALDTRRHNALQHTHLYTGRHQ